MPCPLCRVVHTGVAPIAAGVPLLLKVSPARSCVVLAGEVPRLLRAASLDTAFASANDDVNRRFRGPCGSHAMVLALTKC